MLNSIKNIIKKNRLIYGAAAAVYYFFLRIKYLFIRLFNPMDNNSVLFLSFMGEQYSDNPRALYEYMTGNDKYKDFTFYWVFKEPLKYKELPQLKAAIPVKYRSYEYYRACAVCKYWISNVRMRNELSKRKNQIYLQTWHGTPLKKLGFDIRVKDFKDIGGGLRELQKNYISDAKRYDYMLSVSEFYTESIGSAFGLDRINKQDIFLEYGYPRNDILFCYNEKTADGIREELGLPKDKKTILYAPTFRETQIGSGGYEYSLALDLKDLKERLSDEYVILFRLHYYISKGLDLSEYQGFIYDVSSYDDIAGLYIISDVLVTDYSSVFFDYANLQRPMIFYMYDLEKYNDLMHDFYLSIDELPGAVVYTQEELIRAVKESSDRNFDIEGFNRRFNPHRGSCSAKIIDRIIG